jgi:hypothetical protein
MASHHDRPRPAFGRAYGFAIITGALFLLSWTGQFVFQLIEVAEISRTSNESM